MATTIHEPKKVKLMDGTEIEIRPLKISLLREFTKKFEGIEAVADDNDKSMSLLLECVQIAMKQYKPDLALDMASLEDNIDLPTVYEIIGAASGTGIEAQAAAQLNL
jgi:inhibitor of KinA sporulation pathway (predicted exonuclease)